MISQADQLSSGQTDTDVIARVEKLAKDYHQGNGNIAVHALRGIDLTFRRGEYVAVCGPSGSGKSTLMNILGCLDQPSSGHYYLQNHDVSLLSDDRLSEIRGLHIGFVFQNFNLIPQLTVLENVEVPLFYQGYATVAREAKARELIELVGLSDRGHHRPNELSGGQMQRVAIARALINDPVMILADEPTGNLDTATGLTILEIFDRLYAEGKTILMVTHEPDVAARCHRMIILRDGLVVSDEKHGGATSS